MCPSFPFGFKGEKCDSIVLIPDDCLSIYLEYLKFDKRQYFNTNRYYVSDIILKSLKL